MQSGTIDQCCWDNDLSAKGPGEKSASFLLHEASYNRQLLMIGVLDSRSQCLNGSRGWDNKPAGMMHS